MIAQNIKELMRLLFVRHGQSENNALWARTQSNIDRVSDPPLTPVGKLQIEATAQFLKTNLNSNSYENADPLLASENSEIHIYCSLMERAIQSGLIIAKALSLPLFAHLDIHENGGLYLEDHLTSERLGEPGRGQDEFKNAYPELILPEEMPFSGWWNRPYEERETRRIRARKVIEDLKTRFGSSNSTVIIISHGGFYNYLLRALLALKDDTEAWFDFYNGALTVLEFTSEYLHIACSNRFDFIPENLVT